MAKSKKKKIFYIAILLLLNAGLAYSLLIERSSYVLFANVGQGDASLIRTKENQIILIDGGPTSKILEILGRELPYWQRKIDLVVLTHPHSDHMNGLIDVIKKYEIGMILTNGVKSSESEFKEWERVIREKKVLTKTLVKGTKIILNNEDKIEVLWPQDPHFEEKEQNDSSLVLKLDTRGKDFLFTGDAGFEVLNKLFQVNAEVLKVPHHGSKSGLDKEVLEKINPKTAVIEVGENSYGHPASQIIDLLKLFKVKIFRTDEGTVRIGY
ncbi:MAG: internalization-related competence protein ComEC/Rec2 protein [candidate division CPR2 bacterium GW2011_GWC1_41_48]|uniref:Internalization-related competence protein ComEC/Rec2 protein n=1 Tax=candidate division CPR2 bacterium GW2011_GWC1_41_48 TaxID=1618344 RepID=A0A0G0W6J8_UNCC2|nr:MAG: internalization-related competence protein ComEC/Rec2 protein [candidate division CPR2 bacterium GW2011_GWC2_39_35]KKR27741.1 MAG: internalization-related competence protein ComEC/Rec2 protein [candidate division CPR2 bacterium GW2011_GWD2_39_7]KKS08584.1 MAG: internalization-related competence protein ComEC/Rec2 protein [candidate division CPR2 bacterium GW2011_GWC1_41_48]HCL99845.1 hypothetical protein [candidate division CPR2 bacterium]